MCKVSIAGLWQDVVVIKDFADRFFDAESFVIEDFVDCFFDFEVVIMGFLF